MHSADNLYLPDWEKLHRLIPSNFPPIDLFEQVADPDDLELIFAIESITNDRLREVAGELNLVPPEKRISGAGSTPIMAAFTHIGFSSRFSDGQTYGVYYAARDLKTAIKETVHHRQNFLRLTNEPDTEITMRCYINKVALKMHDIRASEFAHLHTEDYMPSQAFAASMRNNGSHGLIYNSVRDTGGECVAVFNPKALTIPVQAGHYKYQWRSKENKISSILYVSQIEV